MQTQEAGPVRERLLPRFHAKCFQAVLSYLDTAEKEVRTCSKSRAAPLVYSIPRRSR